MGNKKNIPAIRFPDFSGEWEMKKLGEIGDKIMYGMNAAAITYDGENKYLRITDIDEDSRTFLPNPLTSPKGIIEEKYKLKDGDIVFARTGASVGKSYLYKKTDGNLLFAGFLIKFSIKYCDPYFVFTQTLMDSFNKWVQLMSMRSGQPGINAEEYKTFTFLLPTLPEQQKIATFLTAVEDKLTQLKKKKTLLEHYKKGIMQKIFSQKIRFKDDDGRDFPDWEKKKMGDVYSFRTTNSYSRDNLNYEDGEVKNIHYGDIHTKFQSLFDITKEAVPFVNREVPLNKISSDSYCRPGDLIIADASEDYTDIGKFIEIKNIEDQKVVAGLHTLHARPDLFEMSIGFGCYLMKSRDVRLQIMTIAQGTKVLSISANRLSNISISVPCLQEQTKIANFLSAIDDKVGYTTTQIEKTQRWKKGLLQMMFA